MKKLSRREFLKVGLGVSGIIGLSGCPIGEDYFIEEVDGITIEHNVRYAPKIPGEGSFFPKGNTLEVKARGFVDETQNFFAKVPRKLDIYYPIEGERKGAIMAIHGGGWVSGGKNWKWPEYAFNLAKNGFVSVVPDFRLPPIDKWPAMIDDCKLALDWIVENSGQYGIRPEDIGVIGSSSGAHLVSLLSTLEESRDKVRCSVTLYGIYDLVSALGYGEDGSLLRTILGDYEEVVRGIEMGIFGTTYRENPEFFENASPSSHVGAGVKYPKMYLIHGFYDPISDFSQAENFHNMFKEGCQLIGFNGTHGFPQEYARDNWESIVRYFNEQLS